MMIAGSTLTLLLMVAAHSPASADADNRPRHEQDMERQRIRDDVERGVTKSLATLRQIVLARVAGQIVSTKPDREDDRLIYEFRILRDDNRMIEVEVDAASGDILEIENE
ncbi:Propeptide PepSY amd peptidase M4 [Rhizobium sp. PDO1-076]|uniref:PepSY domain-containing protein n=1 Tax=Rhizobium sp. PDO1-076 TaxID=1125979 RepID=UPI00024E2B21|nr:PepSY domain-containing protein [Rhizobium sp. PDO1-076]EHS51726.1 Propeptide PepSY amd peptidase M4 [Rhizobium sp. PDO1-076]